MADKNVLVLPTADIGEVLFDFREVHKTGLIEVRVRSPLSIDWSKSYMNVPDFFEVAGTALVNFAEQGRATAAALAQQLNSRRQ